MTRNKKSGIIVFIIILLIIAGISVYTIFSSKNSNKITSYSSGNGNPSGTISFDYQIKVSQDEIKKPYIGVVYIEGTIEAANSTYNQKWLLSVISKLANDKNNVGMVIYIDSPGGAVYQADEVYLALSSYKKLDKPIYAYMGSMAASGGYYIACPATKIYANRNTLTGSIGVIAGQFIDATELLDNIGIKIDVIHSGKNKLMGNYYEPMTTEQENIMQKISDECYSQFVSIVSLNRPLSYNEVEELADGRVYTATQAVKNKLIDCVDTWDNMMTQFKTNEIGIEDCAVKTFKYEHQSTFVESLIGVFSKMQDKQTASKMGIPSSILEELNSFDSYPAYIVK